MLFLKVISLLLLFRIHLINCDDIVIGEDVIVYGPPSPEYPSGFSKLTNGNFGGYTEGYLKGPPKAPSQGRIIKSSDTEIFLYGDIQYWDEGFVGGVLKFSEDSEWNSIEGFGVYGTILAAHVVGSQLVIAGKDIALAHNPAFPLNGTAQCSIVEKKWTCGNMGHGASNALGPLGQQGDTILGMVNTSENTILIAYNRITYIESVIASITTIISWDFTEKVWTRIFSAISPEGHFPTQSFLTVFDNQLFVSGTFNVTDAKLCNANSLDLQDTIGVWNGECWTYFDGNPGIPPYGGFSKLYSDNTNLVAVGSFNSIVASWSKNTLTWSNMTGNLDQVCQKPSGHIYFSDDLIYVICDSGNIVTTSKVTMHSGKVHWKFLENFQLPKNCGSQGSEISAFYSNNSLWFGCFGVDNLKPNFTLIEYETKAQQVGTRSTVSGLFSVGAVNLLCSFASSIFVAGDFTFAGQESSSLGLAIWNTNTSEWNVPNFEDFPTSATAGSTVNCFGTKDNLYVTYQSTKSNFKVAVVDSDGKIEFYTYKSLVTKNSVIGAMTLVETVNTSSINGKNRILYTNAIVDSTSSVFLELNLNTQNWTVNNFGFTSPTFLVFSAVASKDGILYIAGSFHGTKTDRTSTGKTIVYHNIAKLDVTNNLWMPIEPINTSGSLKTILISGLLVSEQYLYAAGRFEQAGNLPVHNIAGANSEGVWNESVRTGINDQLIFQILYDSFEQNLYMLHKKPGCTKSSCNKLSVYDGQTVTLVAYQGVLNDMSKAYDFIVPGPVKPLLPNEHLKFLIIIFGGSAFVLLLILASILILRYKKKTRATYTIIPEGPDIVIDGSEVKLGVELGAGAFGIVYQGSWRGSEVAVKSIKVKNEQVYNIFIAEIDLLRNLRHPNILMYMGACTQSPSVFILTELCECSLEDVIFHNKTSISWRIKLRIAKEIASAMNFMHSSEPAVVHRDLATKNVFLTENYQVKVGDFGLSILTDSKQLTLTSAGTPVYLSPESILSNHFSTKTDVFSYAIILWELGTYQRPYSEIECGMWRLLSKIANEGLRPDLSHLPKDTPAAFTELIERGWSESPDERPTFSEIVDIVTKLEDSCKIGSSDGMDGSSISNTPMEFSIN